MAELLVRITDKVPPDHPNAHLHLATGEVVVIMPDGHGWSETERSFPEWRIIALPGVPESRVSHLTAPMRVVPHSGWLERRRAFALDLETFDATGDLAASTVRRQPRPDPRHFGDDPRMIG